MRARRTAVLLAAALVTAPACTSRGGGATAAPATRASTATTAAAAPGALHRMLRVDAGGTALDVAVVEPAGFTPGQLRPVLLALPPGGQDRDTTERVVDGRWAPGAREHGWVVISPAAPSTGPYYDAGPAALIPKLLDALAATYPPEGGRVHLAGISNGGLSAFRVALDHPERFASLTTAPGNPPESADEDRLDRLTSIPVALYVGGDDSGWREASQATAATLTKLGGRAFLQVVDGDDHFLRHLDLAAVWARLDSYRTR